MGALILKEGIYAPLHNGTGGWKKNYTELFYYFFGEKKPTFKSPFDLYFHPFIIEFFWFAKLRFKIEEKIHIKAAMLLMYLEKLGERFFCFLGDTVKEFIGNFWL